MADLAKPGKGKAPNPQPTTNDPEWVDAFNAKAEQGHVRVTVASVRVGRVELTDDVRKRTGRSANDLLEIAIFIENRSPNRIVKYQGWGAAEFRGVPRLSDNFGNAYRSVGFGIFTHPVDQVKRFEDIYPGKDVKDSLIFNPPVDGIDYLRLRLSAENFGGTGELRFQIPKRMIANTLPKGG